MRLIAKLMATALLLVAIAEIVLMNGKAEIKLINSYQPYKAFAYPKADSVDFSEDVDTMYMDDYELTHVKFK